jgi:hypothetical protein
MNTQVANDEEMQTLCRRCESLLQESSVLDQRLVASYQKIDASNVLERSKTGKLFIRSCIPRTHLLLTCLEYALLMRIDSHSDGTTSLELLGTLGRGADMQVRFPSSVLLIGSGLDDGHSFAVEDILWSEEFGLMQNGVVAYNRGDWERALHCDHPVRTRMGRSASAMARWCILRSFYGDLTSYGVSFPLEIEFSPERYARILDGEAFFWGSRSEKETFKVAASKTLGRAIESKVPTSAVAHAISSGVACADETMFVPVVCREEI